MRLDRSSSFRARTILQATGAPKGQLRKPTGMRVSGWAINSKLKHKDERAIAQLRFKLYLCDPSGSLVDIWMVQDGEKQGQ